jgi:hypothetical protein
MLSFLAQFMQYQRLQLPPELPLLDALLSTVSPGLKVLPHQLQRSW